MAMFMQKLFRTGGETAWMDHGYREEEEEEEEAPYYAAETISYRIYYPEPPSFTRYPEPPTFAPHFFEPHTTMFNNYPAVPPPPPPPYGMFLEPSAMPPLHHHHHHHLHLDALPPPKLVRFRDPVQQQLQQQQQPAHPRSQPKKVHPEIELKVPMCCSKCEDKVENELNKMEGVREVRCDRVNQKVTVTGKVDPELLLKRARKAKKKAEFWSGTIYSKNFIDFIQSKTAPKQQPEVDVFSSFRHQSSPEMELDTYDLHHETETSATVTHPSPSSSSDSKSDNLVASPCDSELEGSSYNQLLSPYSERDTYDRDGQREREASYTYGVMDSRPPPSHVFPSSLSCRHHAYYEERDYSPEYESCSTSFRQYKPSYKRYDSRAYQDSQRSVYGNCETPSYGEELESYPHNVYSSGQSLGTTGITNPNYMKRIIDY